MSKNQPISTYSPELREYFDRQVKKSFWRPWITTVDVADVSVGLGPVNIGKLTDIFRNVTKESRYRYAVWNWLRPHPPYLDLKDLTALQKVAGLDHLDSAAFIPNLQAHCKEMLRQHQSLRLWIERRLALLDYRLNPPVEVPEALRNESIRLRHALLQVFTMLWQKQFPEADKFAQKLTALAMDAAARAAFDVFATRPCRISANLMVPAFLKNAGGPGYTPTPMARERAAKAADLWSEIGKAEKCLVVVGETKEAQHIGFWIPIIRGDGNTCLPGAPQAFQQMEGSAVFTEDLPPLIGFSKKLETRWIAYMHTEFREKMFVSLPFKVPGVGFQAADDPVVAAVLNVNADPPEEDGWKRAYHREWLIVARDRVAPFVEVAFQAFLVSLAASGMSGQDVLMVDTGIKSWDTLPNFEELKLLPGGRNE